jgi:hypothetical protein
LALQKYFFLTHLSPFCVLKIPNLWIIGTLISQEVFEMKARMSDSCRLTLVVILCQLLLLQPAFAQTGAQAGMRIVIVRGDRAKNVIQQIPPEALTVRVEDTSRRPVDGATVLFTAPANGPGGQFPNGSTTVRVTTNPDGLATAEGYHPNATAGPYMIQVRAEYQGLTAAALIEQTNVEPGKSHTKLIITILSVAGVAAGATLLARRNGGDSSSIPTFTLGDAAVGAPKH